MADPSALISGTAKAGPAKQLHGRESQPEALTPDDLQGVVGGIAIIGTLFRNQNAT
jgi:hypothetical protein